MRGLWIALLGLLAVGCSRPTQAVMEDVDPYNWSREVCVRIENGDTLTLRDFSLVIRSNRHFQRDTLELEMTLQAPDSSHYSEVVAFPMNHPRRAAALRLIDEAPYRRHVILNQFGAYRLTITPTEPIRGVEAVGVNIVRSN